MEMMPQRPGPGMIGGGPIDRKKWRVAQRAAGQCGARFGLGLAHASAIDAVDLGECDRSSGYT
ncbi:MAG TPA: hypothetical protein VL220_16720 [Steroidobacteraceae bacterium]|nr:hypothetical protein [Steroidobacteraceae bacterium]